MNKRKLKIKLSPDESADLRAVLDCTKDAADEVVQQIVIARAYQHGHALTNVEHLYAEIPPRNNLSLAVDQR